MSNINQSGQMSLARLYEQANKLAVNMRRDLQQFETVGIGEDVITVFENETRKVFQMDSDENWVGRIVDGTNVCTKAEKALRLLIHDLGTKIFVHFGNDGANNIQRLISAPSQLSKPELATVVASLIVMLKAAPSIYEEALIDAAYIQNLEKIYNDYTESIAARNQIEAMRKSATHNRKSGKSELLGKMKYYANIGKRLWFGVDNNKMRDYTYLRARPRNKDAAKQVTIPSTDKT